jgi:hypothetical protein
MASKRAPIINWYIFGKQHLLCGDIKSGPYYEFVQLPIKKYNHEKRLALVAMSYTDEEGSQSHSDVVVHLDEASMDRYFAKNAKQTWEYLASIDCKRAT